MGRAVIHLAAPPRVRELSSDQALRGLLPDAAPPTRRVPFSFNTTNAGSGVVTILSTPLFIGPTSLMKVTVYESTGPTGVDVFFVYISSDTRTDANMQFRDQQVLGIGPGAGGLPFSITPVVLNFMRPVKRALTAYKLVWIKNTAGSAALGAVIEVEL